MLREAAVEPSDQLWKIQRVSIPCTEGVVIVHERPSAQDSEAGAVWVAAVQPVPEMLNSTPATLLRMLTCAVRRVKLAVIFLGPFIGTVIALIVPVRSPDHPANW
jgi:hypothetical protein